MDYATERRQKLIRDFSSNPSRKDKILAVVALGLWIIISVLDYYWN